MTDVSDEYATLSDVVAKFSDWRATMLEDYTSSFASLRYTTKAQ